MRKYVWVFQAFDIPKRTVEFTKNIVNPNKACQVVDVWISAVTWKDILCCGEYETWEHVNHCYYIEEVSKYIHVRTAGIHTYVLLFTLTRNREEIESMKKYNILYTPKILKWFRNGSEWFEKFFERLFWKFLLDLIRFQ